MASLADEIVSVLKAHGTTRIFGIPGGGSSLDLIDAADRVGIPFTLARTEAAATIMAATTGELTGTPGAALVGVGPGASSAVNGIAYASIERSPVVLFVDGPASSLHQHLDQQAIFAPLCRGTAQLTPGGGAATLDGLLTLATTPREGPVMVELTAADAAAEATPVAPGADGHVPPPHPADVDAARALIAGSERPILVVGLEARHHGDAVRAFAHAIQGPALTTYKAGGTIDAADPFFLGPATGAAGEIPVLAEADLIIGVGFDPIEFIPGIWPETLAPVLMLSEAAPENPRVPVAVRVTGPLDDILGALTPAGRSPWPSIDIARLKSVFDNIYNPRGDVFSNAAAAQVMAETLPHDTRITVDAGAHMFALFGLWPAAEPLGMLKSNGLSSMGYALPAAIASALTEPERPVVAVTGDGGLSMCLGELATAAELGLDITVVVINDATLSLIDIKQQRQQRPSRGVRYPALDYAEIAKTFGWQGVTARTADELAAALSGTGLRLIDVRIDPAGYGDEMTRLRG